MKKRYFIIVMLVMVLFGLTACGKKNEEKTDALKFKEEYESLNGTTREKDGKTIRSIEIPKNNPMVYKSASDIIEMMENKETFVVYFGFSDCPWCRSIIPTMMEVADDLGIHKIYYVDVGDIRDTMKLDDDGSVITDKKGSEGYYDLLEVLEPVLSGYTLTDKDGNEVNTGEKRIYAPNIISVLDGVAVENTEGISEKQTNGYMELTEEMKKESYNIIKCSIQCVADNSRTCSLEKSC